MRRVFYAFKHVILLNTRQNVVCTNDNSCLISLLIPEKTVDVCFENKKYVRFFRDHRIIQKGVSTSEVALRLSFGRCYFEMQANHANNGYHAELVL